MTPQELSQLLKDHHWILQERTEGKQKSFIAKQRQGKTVVSRYLATENRLQAMTEEEILAKLNK